LIYKILRDNGGKEVRLPQRAGMSLPQKRQVKPANIPCSILPILLNFAEDKEEDWMELSMPLNIVQWTTNSIFLVYLGTRSSKSYLGHGQNLFTNSAIYPQLLVDLKPFLKDS
jgi:hypothetical protein